MPIKLVKIAVLDETEPRQFELAQRLQEATQSFKDVSNRLFYIGMKIECIEATHFTQAPDKVKLQFIKVPRHSNTKVDIAECLNMAHAIIFIPARKTTELLAEYIERVKQGYQALSKVHVKPITIIIADDEFAQAEIKIAVARDAKELLDHINWASFKQARDLEVCFKQMIDEAIKDRRYQEIACLEKSDAIPVTFSVPLSATSKAVTELTMTSRITGAVIAATLGMLTAIFIYNPVASVYAYTKQFWRTKSFKNFNLMLFAILYGPLQGIFIEGLIKQGQQGWRQGLAASVRTPKNCFKDATSASKILRSKDGYQVAVFLSKRDLIFSLLVTGLISGAVLSVVFLPASFVVSLPTVVYMQLAGFSTPILALFAGLTSFVVATFLYEMSIFIYDSLLGDRHNGFQQIKTFASQEIKNYQELTWDNKLAGCVTGVLLSPLIAAIIYNPIAAYYKAFREFWRETIGLEKLINFGNLLLAPLLGPLQGILIQGIYQQSQRGWEKGFIKSLKTPLKVIKKGPEIRDVIASIIVASLVAAVVWSVIFPPIGITWLVPAFLVTIGLSNLSPWILAVLVGSATFMIASILYGISSQIYDLVFKEPSRQYRPVTEHRSLDAQEASLTKATSLLSQGGCIINAKANNAIDNDKMAAKQGVFSHFNKVFSCLGLSWCGEETGTDASLDGINMSVIKPA